MTRVGQGQPTHKTPPTFEPEAVELTLYFFARLRSIYGSAKFKKEWPTEADEKVAKREWARNIAKHTKEEINQAFDHCKRMIEKGEKDFMWPNVGMILSGCKKTLCPAHNQLPAPKESEEEKQKQRAWAKKLENMISARLAK